VQLVLPVHVPVTAPHKQIWPAPHSASLMQPYSQTVPLPAKFDHHSQ